MRYNGIIILLVFCLTLLLLTGCIINTAIAKTAIGNVENQEDINQSINNFQCSSTGSVHEPTEEPGTKNSQKWSGLGMGLYFHQVSYVDMLLANGFTELRIDIPDYQNTSWLEQSKVAVISAVAKGAKVIWGVSSNKGNSVDYIITAENWCTYRKAILDAAKWAEDNGVYEFQLGNEEENHINGTTMTVDQLIANLKSVATDVQKIFTNGNVSYSCWQDSIDDWITVGKGDIDILASNVYMGGTTFNDTWKTKITNLVNVFGVDGTYLTEFNLSWTSLDDYSIDEAVQAAGVTEMINYIKASGMTRALWFNWKDNEYGHWGVVKDDGTYTTVPITTTTILLPRPKKNVKLLANLLPKTSTNHKR
jgi:hypothetical protein